LRVAELWEADPTRLLHEATALRLCHDLTPTNVPVVLDLDPDALVLATGHAPLDWTDLRRGLLEDREPAFSPGTAATLGKVLGQWHRATRLNADRLRGDLQGGDVCFDQLRVTPFYNFTADRLPELAPHLLHFAADLEREDFPVLVHGDFSPKNFLVGGTGLWVIDHEVAHVGSGCFDLAFLLAHLVLKSVHLKHRQVALREMASTFGRTYEAASGRELAPDWVRVSAHVGCLVLARVHGKSPATYLVENDRALADQIGRRILSNHNRANAAEWPWTQFAPDVGIDL
jgi:aminoglycoside phosphotransferase (APT) family kinase protein